MTTEEGTELERKEDFNYLCSWIDSTEKDMKIGKAQAWRALTKMKNVWESRASRDLKIRFFLAAVESISLYGCESCTKTPQIECSLNGIYTHMLRTVLNVQWWTHTTNWSLYVDLHPVGDQTAARRMQPAGHCWRHHHHPEMNGWKTTTRVQHRESIGTGD